MQQKYIDEYKSRAVAIVLKMSLSEKISQLRHHSKALPKYGIEEYNWWNECLHGVARAGIATVFPQAIAMAATFDEDILNKVGDIISTEARAKHHEAARMGSRKIYEGLTFWSPNINIYRDPRWGRGQETYGECPTLTARLGCAFIKGLQGNDDKHLKVSACAKHYAVHSGPEADRHSFNAEVSKKDLAETYLYAFKQAVKDAGVESVMGAYNRVNGEACCASENLLQDILRDKWGFDGHVVSDCGALYDIVFKHHMTLNPLKGVAMAINSGLDLECGTFYAILPWAVRTGLVKEDTIDKALTRLLVTRMKLGMFDNDCKYQEIPYSLNACKAHEQYAIEVAEKSIVLLHNDGILPLKDVKSIALLGFNAVNELAYLGNYYGTPSSFITVFDGLKNIYGDKVSYEQTIPLFKPAKEAEFKKGIDLAAKSEIVIVCTGLDSSVEGEQMSRRDAGNTRFGDEGDRSLIALPQVQLELLNNLIKLNKKIIILNFSGGCMDFSPVINGVSAILQCWYPGAKGGQAIANIISGRVSPSGRLPVTFYKYDSDLPDFHDYDMKDRTYRYFKNDPLYYFGYGMSYTTFSYSDLLIGKNVEDDMIAEVKVKNVGAADSDEVIQIYIKYPEKAKDQPKIKLIDFRRIHIKAGNTASITFKLNKSSFGGYDIDGNYRLFSGDYTLYAGGGQPQSNQCISASVQCDSDEIIEKTYLK
jgi:beta-glucosidase